MTETPQGENLLSARVSVRYGEKPAVLRDVAFEIRRGEVLGLVGQSGSGKSTLAMAILGLLDRKRATIEGAIDLDGCDLVCAPRARTARAARTKNCTRPAESAVVAESGAEDSHAVERSVAGACLWIERRLRCGHPRGAASVSLPPTDEFLQKYPSQISVGQAQRVLIAMAVMHRPALLIADEATSALDVITQSEILALFRELNRSTGMAILYISHDLASVAGICDRIAILHEGQIVETGTTEQVLTNPRHEYTQRLMAAMPRMPQRLALGKAAAI